MTRAGDRRTMERRSPNEPPESGSHMTNSHILSQRFAYARPSSVQETLQILKERGENARLLAGGTNLLVDLKLEKASATRTAELPGQHPAGEPMTVVDISRLPGLRGVEERRDGVHIGALTPIRELATSPLLWEKYTALAEAAAAFGSTQVAIMGTIGGNVANGSPASDTVPALLVFGADATLVGPEGERVVSVGDLLEAPGRTRIRAGEILTSIRLPLPTPGTASAFLKISRVRADLSKVSVAVRVARDGDRVTSARIELGSVGPTIVRARDAETVLSQEPLDSEAAKRAGERAAAEIRPIDDVRSTADYRRRAAIALVHDSLLTAWKRASAGVKAVPRAPHEQTQAVPSGERDGLVLQADEKSRITLTVNGTRHELDVFPNELLLNVLREKLELTGSKYGCGIGECGACTVWLDGQPVLGCLVLAVSTDGRSVLTIEGEAVQGELSALQRAFVDENAFQCGYCTPGMVMMAKKLLEEIGEPTEDEIRDYLKGNYCRCTGYASIVRAVRRAAGLGQGTQE